MKKLIENRFYRDENLTSENIVNVFNLAGWRETRDWIGRDDDLTFVKGPSRISFNIVTNSGYNFTYYKDFESNEYSADYIIYSGGNLKELEKDIEDFNNLDGKDFLKYKAPGLPWDKNIQEIEMLENRKMLRSRKLKEARLRNVGRGNQITPHELIQMSRIFFEDEDFREIENLKTPPRPNTFKVIEDNYDTSISVAITGDYEDDIIINVFFNTRCGYGYVIQAQTTEGYVEWTGLDKTEFKEDLEDAYVNARKFFKVNEDKHTFESWISLKFDRDEASEIFDKLYQIGDESIITQLMTQDEFEAKMTELQ